MTLYFGDGTNISTATGLGANFINSDISVKTDAAGVSVGWGGTSGDAIAIDYAAASSSNKLLILCTVTVGLDFGGRIGAELYIGGARESGATAGTEGNRQRRSSGEHAGHSYDISSCSFNYIKTSPSTNSTRYSIRLGQGDNGTRTVYINRPHNEPNESYQMRGTSSITILEFST